MSIEIIILAILLIIICIVLIATIIYFQRIINDMRIKLEKKMNNINEVLSFQQSFNIQ